MRRNAATIYKFDSEPRAQEIMDYIYGSKKRAEKLKLVESDIDSKPAAKKAAKAELDKIPLGDCPLIVTGEIGMGKTALLAACLKSSLIRKMLGSVRSFTDASEARQTHLMGGCCWMGFARKCRGSSVQLAQAHG